MRPHPDRQGVDSRLMTVFMTEANMERRASARSTATLSVDRAALERLAVDQRLGGTIADVLVAAVALLWMRYRDLDQVTIGCARFEEVQLEPGTPWRLQESFFHRLDRASHPRFSDFTSELTRASESNRADRPHDPSLVLAAESLGAISENFLWFNVFSCCSIDSGRTAIPERLNQSPPAAALSTQLFLDGGTAELHFRFFGDLIDDAITARFVANLQNLLRSIGLDPAGFGDAFSILGDDERRQVLFDWNERSWVPACPQGPSLLAGLSGQATRNPNQPALIEGSSLITYRQLEEQTNQWARALRRRGIGPGVTVATCLPRSQELVTALIALYKSGAAFAPLDPSYPSVQLERQLTQSQAGFLITRSPPLRLVPGDGRTCIELDRLIQEAAGESRAPLEGDIPGDTLAALFFTSGSTGESKAVPSRRRDFWTNAGTAVWYGLGAGDRHVFKSALDSTLLGREINWPLATGGTLVVVPEAEAREPAALARLLTREHITFMTLVPSLLRELLEQPEFRHCSALKQICCFGEALPHDVIERVRHQLSASLSSFYGATEAPTVCLWQQQADGTRPRGSLGFRLDEWSVYVLDRLRQPVPVGAVGELYVSGRHLTPGVLDAGQESGPRILPNPFAANADVGMYQTGDRVRWCADGSLEFAGRVDDQLKIRGYRVEPAQVEVALSDHPEIAECAVVARPNESGDNQLVAFFVYRSSCPSVGELRRHLEGRLPRQYLPGAFIPLEQLPRRPGGKLDRQALPADLSQRLRPQAGGQPPRHALEHSLHQFWREILELDRVGIDDDFFELGGNSLHAMRLVSRIQCELGAQLPMEALFAGPTIRRLARLVSDPSHLRPDGLLVDIRPRGIKRPLFVFGSATGNTLHWQPLLKHLDPERPVLGVAYPRTPAGQPRGNTLAELIEPVMRQIIARQPAGGLYLAGYSAGVVPVFELAQQLERAGRQVVFLGLIDAATPNGGGWGNSVRNPGGCLRNLWSWIRHSNHGQALNSWRKRLRQYSSRRMSTDVATGRHDLQREIVAAFRTTVRGYQPQSYSGRVTLFRAGVQTPWRFLGENYGWRRYCPRLECRVIPQCDHFDLMREPHVAVLGQEIEQAIRSAERAVSLP